MPIVYPLLIVSMGLSYAQIGRVVLVRSLFGTILQPVFGHLSDRWGSRNLIIFSIAWIGTWMGLVGFVTEYWMLFVVVSMGALGSAAYHPPGAAIASQGGVTRRGAAMAVFSVGGNFGAALSPLVIGFVIASLGLPGTAVVMPIASGYVSSFRDTSPVMPWVPGCCCPTSCTRSPLRATNATAAPRSRSAPTSAKPSPDVPPVMATRRPFNVDEEVEVMIFSLLVCAATVARSGQVRLPSSQDTSSSELEVNREYGYFALHVPVDHDR